METFDEASTDIHQWIARVLSEEECGRLMSMIATWRSMHPDAINVEAVRFSELPMGTRGVTGAGDSEGFGRLVQSARAAMQTADSALLLGERAMHYAQRAPFLIRMQVRLGVHEVMNESASSLVQLGQDFVESTTAQGALDRVRQVRHGVRNVAFAALLVSAASFVTYLATGRSRSRG